jgi:lipid II:glycine glycyltransferase (peptidoglycan interpeptide bridge formation enzyme)
MPPTPSLSDPAWDRLVSAHPNGHFLQSSAWGRLRVSQGWQLRRAVQNGSKTMDEESLPDIGAQILVQQRPFARFAYIPRGPVCAPDDPRLPDLIAAIDAATRDCLFVRIEPHWADEAASHQALAGLALRPAASVQPPSTLRLDLSLGPEALLKDMKQKWRYNVGLAARKDVVVREEGAAGAAVLETLVAETAQRNGFHARPQGYYRAVFESFRNGDATSGVAQLYVARYQETPLAATLVIHHGESATYLYGGSGAEERNRMPNHAIQWHAIEAAREAGLRWYDFWGIPDAIGKALAQGETLETVPEGEDGLWGVWGFKRGFGGEVWRAASAFDRVHAPLRYRLAIERLPRLRATVRSLIARKDDTERTGDTSR